MTAENPQPQEDRKKPDFSKALEMHEKIIATDFYWYGGDPRAVGREGLVQEARRRDARRQLENLAEPSYDDPDYAPGHGSGYIVEVDLAADKWMTTDNLGLHGPELAPDFKRKDGQRQDFDVVVETMDLEKDREWLNKLFNGVEQPNS